MKRCEQCLEEVHPTADGEWGHDPTCKNNPNR